MKNIFILILFLATSIFSQDVSNKIRKESVVLAGGYLGIGYGVISGSASEYFNNPILIPITGDIVFKNFITQLNLDSGYSRVSKTMEFGNNKSWNEGADAWYNAFGINVGYSMFSNNQYRLTPIIGYASTYTKKKWWGPSDIAEYEPENHCVTVGVLLDFKSIIFYNEKNTPEYNGLRISAGVYIPVDDPVYPDYYSGTTFYLTIGFVSLQVL
jgi:hypothetical protein